MTKDSHCCHFWVLFFTSQFKKSCCYPHFHCPGRYHNFAHKNSFCLAYTASTRERSGASGSRSILGWLIEIDRPNFYPLERERSSAVVWFIFPASPSALREKESSRQIFVGVLNMKELMSPLCHLHSEPACSLGWSLGCTGLWVDDRAASPCWVQAEPRWCAPQNCPGLCKSGIRCTHCSRWALEQSRRFYCHMMKVELRCLLTPSHELGTVMLEETRCKEAGNSQCQRRMLLTQVNV